MGAHKFIPSFFLVHGLPKNTQEPPLKNVDVSQYTTLLPFLKTLTEGYEPKKSKFIEAENFNRYIQKTNNQIYLAIILD